MTSNLRNLVSAITCVVIVLTVSIARVASGGDKGEYDSYNEEIEAWIEQRDARLRQPDYYLSIVGLYWLEEGANTFGSDPSSDIVFSKKAPRLLGSFNVKDRVVTVEMSPGADVKHDGDRVTSMILLNDHDANGPTLLTLGTLTWYVLQRGDNRLIRLKDSQSKLLRDFKGVERFPVDESWRIESTIERYTPGKWVALENTINVVTKYHVVGALVFEIDGETYRLDAVEYTGSKQMWILFADETSGVDTYGGGRYIYVDFPGDDGKVIIDFNRAYNPPCAFNKHTTCELPPPQNILPIPVAAGEKTYKK